MLDRRGFLAAMLGAAVAPKDVLSGIATPAPVTKAVSEWVSVSWKELGPATYDGDNYFQIFQLDIKFNGDEQPIYQMMTVNRAEEMLERLINPPITVKKVT